MGKITKQQLRLHEQAEELLWGSDKKLTQDQVAFCLAHWDPRALAGKHVARNQARVIDTLLPQCLWPLMPVSTLLATAAASLTSARALAAWRMPFYAPTGGTPGKSR